ncbi:MAG: STAS domain-containing protein [Actinomycetota bacterium]|nr:STAS domain-containing protein [Actinomycetota bacterium]
MPTFELTTESGENGAVRLRFSGELDIATAPEVEEELRRLEAGAPPVLVLDLRGLEFMDSTGLRTVVAADTRAREAGRRLVVVRGPAAVDRIFTVTQLDERLEIVEDLAAAEGGSATQPARAPASPPRE